jgi:hypothetical protein
MRAQQSGRRIALEKIYMGMADVSSVSISLPQLGETIEYPSAAWVGVAKPFEPIRMECTLPLDVAIRASRLLEQEVQIVVRCGAISSPVTLAATDMGLFTRPIAYIDTIDEEYVAGWAWDPECDQAVTLSLRKGDHTQQVLANRYRADLDMLGIGIGLHGFKCRRTAMLSMKNIELIYKDQVIGRFDGK